MIRKVRGCCMKLAVLQINAHCGAVEKNAQKIIATAMKAASLGAQLAVTPELAVSGPPAADNLLYPAFINRVQLACAEIAAALAKLDMTLLLGTPGRFQENQQGPLYNQALLVEHGELRQAYCKQLLNPLFDAPYFKPGQKKLEVDFDVATLGITIGEDWKLYRQNAEGINLLACLDVIPFSLGQRGNIRREMGACARKIGASILCANAVGASDGLIYDGGSFLADKQDGRIRASAPFFEEDILFIDTETSNHSETPEFECAEEEIFAALVLGLRDYFTKTGLKKAILGLSGGIDSALVAVIACEALGAANVSALLMPSPWSSEHSVADARALAANLGMTVHVIPIKGIISACEQALAPIFGDLPKDVTEENIQARIRGLLLMAAANKFGAVLLATGNRSEIATGYCTLYGDTCGALEVIGDLYKTEVYQLCRWINKTRNNVIPENILTKAPSAELRPNQKDEDSLPPYDMLDLMLKAMLDAKLDAAMIDGFSENKTDKIKEVGKLVGKAQFKRAQAPPVLAIRNQAGLKLPVSSEKPFCS